PLSRRGAGSHLQSWLPRLCPSPPFRGEREGPRRGSDREGEAGGRAPRRRSFPPLTPTPPPPRGGEGGRMGAECISPLASDQAGLVDGRADEGSEQRVRLKRFGFELRVELHADIPGMIGKLDDLRQHAVR